MMNLPQAARACRLLGPVEAPSAVGSPEPEAAPGRGQARGWGHARGCGGMRPCPPDTRSFQGPGHCLDTRSSSDLTSGGDLSKDHPNYQTSTRGQAMQRVVTRVPVSHGVGSARGPEGHGPLEAGSALPRPGRNARSAISVASFIERGSCAASTVRSRAETPVTRTSRSRSMVHIQRHAGEARPRHAIHGDANGAAFAPPAPGRSFRSTGSAGPFTVPAEPAVSLARLARRWAGLRPGPRNIPGGP
jgi:hypothetical protein